MVTPFERFRRYWAASSAGLRRRRPDLNLDYEAARNLDFNRARAFIGDVDLSSFGQPRNDYRILRLKRKPKGYVADVQLNKRPPTIPALLGAAGAAYLYYKENRNQNASAGVFKTNSEHPRRSYGPRRQRWAAWFKATKEQGFGRLQPLREVVKPNGTKVKTFMIPGWGNRMTMHLIDNAPHYGAYYNIEDDNSVTPWRIVPR